MDWAERLDDREESLRLALESAQAQMWTALPGIITAVDLAAQTCTVQPAITGEVEDSGGQTKAVQLPLLVDVPLVFPRAGGFALTFPVRAGDECLVVFSCRCIDGWWQGGSVSPPAESRMHDLSDGFAILAPTSQPRRLRGVSGGAVELRTESGDAFISLDAAGTITLKGKVQVQGTITCNGVNISDTHTHGNVEPGPARTGTPA